ncbi:MAG: phage virion morphogenesis protein [Candidatus Sedimenticola sp. (ex Thyasira tokunagai)]
MAGASIRVDYKISDQAVTDVLDRLVLAGGDMETAFSDFGAYLELSHLERFDRQEAPDGTPWEPLNPKYQARKKKNADKILVLEGFMRDLLAYNASTSGLEFGTNQIQGATHQFGDPARGIPERPFIGLSPADETELLDTLQEHLTDALRP